MTDCSVTPPVRRSALALGRGEMSLLNLHEMTNHVIAHQRSQYTEVHAGEQRPIEVRQPHHEDGEAHRVDQAESHAHAATVDQNHDRGDGQEHEDEQCGVHPSVITRLGPVDQDPRMDQGQKQPSPRLVQELDRFHFAPFVDDDRRY